VTFRAVDHRGRTVGTSRDLAELQRGLAGRARAGRPHAHARAVAGGRRVAGATERVGIRSGAAAIAERTGITTWDVGTLPEVVDTRVAAASCAAIRRSSTRRMPSRCASSPPRARRAPHARGRPAPAAARRPSPSAYVLEHLTAAEKLSLAASPYPSAKALIEDARVAVADAVMARTHRRRPHTGAVRRVRDASRPPSSTSCSRRSRSSRAS
jgi:ATP-dependent helicase HrpA